MFEGISPENMAWYGTNVPPFWDPGDLPLNNPSHQTNLVLKPMVLGFQDIVPWWLKDAMTSVNEIFSTVNRTLQVSQLGVYSTWNDIWSIYLYRFYIINGYESWIHLSLIDLDY